MQNDPDETGTEPRSRTNPGKKPSESRSTRSIRFSDAEWKRIEKQANARGMSASELVRYAAVGLATGRFSDPPQEKLPGFPPEIPAQIERIYHGVYLLATLKRDELIREGRQKEVEKIVRKARISREAILNAKPESDG